LGRPAGIIQNFNAVNTFRQNGKAAEAAASGVSSRGVVSFDVPNAVCPAYTLYCIYPAAINPQGDITGSYIDPAEGQQGFIRYASGTFVKFNVPGSSCCVTPVGIDLEGTVAGYFTDANSITHGFLRYATGHISIFDPKGSISTAPAGINALGDVAGSYTDANYFTHGFIRHANGVVITFDPAGSTVTSPAAINLAGTTIGYYDDSSFQQHGFVRSANGSVASFDPDDATYIYPLGINLFGDVTGYYLVFSFPPFTVTQSSFLRDVRGNLTTITVPGSQATATSAISLAGVIVGGYIAPDGSCPAFLRQPSGSFSSFAPAGAQINEGHCVNPTAISDLNVVIGNYVDQNGVQRGFFRIP